MAGGCAPSSAPVDAAAGADERSYTRTLSRAPDEVYAVNPLAQQLITYSSTARRPTAMTNEPNYFYYGFRTASDLYTVGHSIEYRYEIREITPSAMRTIAAVPEGQGVFPLTSDDEGAIFARYTFDANGAETRREVVELDGAELVPWVHVSGAVSYAAIVDSWLYYTVWHESTADYSLERVNRNDKSARPRPVRESLARGEIYAHGGNLFVSNGDRLTSGDREVECDDLCWFRDDPNVLVKMSVSDSGALRLDVHDGRDFSVIASIRGVVGFRIESDAVHVYGEGFEKRVKVPETS